MPDRPGYPSGMCNPDTCPACCDFCAYSFEWAMSHSDPGPELVFYSVEAADADPGDWCLVKNEATWPAGLCENFRCDSLPLPPTRAYYGATREAAVAMQRLIDGPLAHVWHAEGKVVPRIPVDLFPSEAEMEAAGWHLGDERRAAVLAWARGIMVRDLDRLSRWEPKPEKPRRRRKT